MILKSKYIPIHFKSHRVSIMIYYWAHDGGYGTADDIVRKCNKRHSTKRGQAKHRGINFELTHDEHFEMLLSDYNGKPVFSQIGSKSDNLCLQRKGDEGHYTVDNCCYDTVVKNIRDGHKNNPSILPGIDNIQTKYRHIGTCLSTGEVKEFIGNVALRAAGFNPSNVSRFAVHGSHYSGGKMESVKGWTFERELL